MARNFSCRPSEFYGLDCESLIAKDFDLACNLRLVLNDFERDKKMAEASMMGMGALGGGQEMAVNDGLLEETMDSPLNQMN